MNWQKRWRALWNPDYYHGWGKTKNYFEGWYFKIVNAEKTEALAFIPGVAYDTSGDAEAFIQVIDGIRVKSSYFSFPIDQFWASSTAFEIKIGDHFFSRSKIQLDVSEYSGELFFENHVRWPKRLKAPGIMGWYSFVPFMECYHGIVSLHHSIRGHLEISGQPVSFDGGIGYTEKDWGQSFPKTWIWVHSNHFDTDKRCCLMASVARIPWLNSSFTGFITGFLWGDDLYEFATYNGAKMTFSIRDQEVQLNFMRADMTLSILAAQAEGVDLIAPIQGEMRGKVNESMQATVQIRLTKGNRVLFEGEGHPTGMEIGGDIALL